MTTTSTAAYCCEERWVAQRNGELFFHAHVQGWVWPAQNRTTALPVFTITFCPFCDSPLPDLAQASERAPAPAGRTYPQERTEESEE